MSGRLPTFFFPRDYEFDQKRDGRADLDNYRAGNRRRGNGAGVRGMPPDEIPLARQTIYRQRGGCHHRRLRPD